MAQISQYEEDCHLFVTSPSRCCRYPSFHPLIKLCISWSLSTTVLIPLPGSKNCCLLKSLSGQSQLDALSSSQQAAGGGYTVFGPPCLHDGFSQVQGEVTLLTPVLLPFHCLNPQILLTRNHALSCTPAFPTLAGPCLHQSSTTARASLAPRPTQGVGHQWATRAERAAQWEQSRVQFVGNSTGTRPSNTLEALVPSSSPSSQPPEAPYLHYCN